MKLDADTLVKNRFWIMIGVFVPLVLIAVLYLGTGVAGELEVEKKKLDTHQAELLAKQNAKLRGKREEDLLKTKSTALEARKETIWAEAWKLQDGMQVWPKALVEESPDEKFGGKPIADYHFGDNLKSELCALYSRTDVYDAQMKKLGETFHLDVVPGKVALDPVIFKDGWKNVLRAYVKEWKSTSGPPSAEEVWLAQEDYWVQRELLNTLKEANRSIGRFKKVKSSSDANDPLQGSFENNYWRLDLVVFKKDQGFAVKGKLTNPEKTADGQVRPRREQPIGQIWFGLNLYKDENAKLVPFAVEGDSLGPGKSIDIREKMLVVEAAPEGIFGVEQLFDARTSPIKRIDQIALGQHSHRTYQPGLKPPPARPAFSATRTGTPRVQPKGAGPGPRLEGGGAAAAGATENGVATLRYSNVTDQVRRMPVGLVLLVDQAHIPDVEAALVSSRLRFQTTQVNWQHYRGAIGPNVDKVDKDAPPMGKGRPEIGPGGGDPKEGDEQVKNVVELAIYGVASLYERPGTRGVDPKRPIGKGPREPKKGKDKDSKDKDKDKDSDKE